MISIITPVWNRSDMTQQFLYRNWQIYERRPEVEFIIVDNGSTDNTPGILNQWRERMGERLVVHRSEENTGFGPGHNAGGRLAKGDVLVFLSNDVIPLGDYVAQVEAAANETPGALMGPELVTYDTGWNKFGGKVLPYLFGWCVFCTPAVWQRLGGWDERYVPCDYEDLDISLAAVELGIELREVKLPLQHLCGQSAQNLSGGRLAITLESQRKFKEKWNFA